MADGVARSLVLAARAVNDSLAQIAPLLAGRPDATTQTTETVAARADASTQTHEPERESDLCLSGAESGHIDATQREEEEEDEDATQPPSEDATQREEEEEDEDATQPPSPKRQCFWGPARESPRAGDCEDVSSAPFDGESPASPVFSLPVA